VKFFIFPSPQEASDEASCHSPVSRDISLGGFFYDYLCRSDGSLAGIRYNIMDDVAFNEHPVYRQFLVDRRFSFQPGEHVEFVFGDRDIDALQLGQLDLLVVQDFYGESVIDCDGRLGIVFDIPDGWQS
jgi:hypothetical protein